MEKLLRAKIIEYLDANNLISQHSLALGPLA